MSRLQGDLRIVHDVAEAFADTVVAAYRGRSSPRFTLVLSGGSTARPCYERLASQSIGTIDWEEVDVFMGDERCVAPDDPDANQRLVRESLLDRIGPVGSFHPMLCQGTAISCLEGAQAYEKELSAIFDQERTLDLVHLGLGPDGHTASLFPDSEGLEAPPDRFVVTNVDPHGNNQHIRMTLTFSAIARADQVVFTVSGPSKRSALDRLRAGEALPAARVRAGRVLWLADTDAAGDE